jgi:hypothetical protein
VVYNYYKCNNPWNIYNLKLMKTNNEKRLKFNQLVNNIVILLTSSYYWHWMTTSHAEHITLREFYENLGELVDRLAEAGQGNYGKRLMIPTSISLLPYGQLSKSLLEYKNQLNKYIMDCNSEDIKNILAETIELINSQIYKNTQV